MGTNKVVMWSFPIVKDVDLRAEWLVHPSATPDPGPASSTEVSFLEGNSNLGDAIRIDKSAGED